MSDDGQPSATVVESPFDDVNADIILHTSDNVDFHVFRLVLTLSSSFFQCMFSLPQPANVSTCQCTNGHSPYSTTPSAGEPSKPPSIDMPEDSKTLDTLLRFLYPNTHIPRFHDVLHARNVAVAASKYDMSTALDRIADKVQTQYVATRPLHVYFIACRMGWEDVAREAAKYCLDPSLTPDDGPECDDLLHYPGAGVAYHRLQTYRDACRSAVEERLEEMGYFDDDLSDCEDESRSAKRVRDQEGVSGHCLKQWRAQYISNIKQAVLKCPRKESLDDYDLSPSVYCQRCKIDVVHDISVARSEVESVIDDVLSEVELHFST